LRNTQEILRQAISDGLFALGEPIMNTILWHLKSQGVFLDSNSDVDINLFYQQLEQIVGNIADTIMDEIYESLIQRIPNNSYRLKDSTPVIDKIEKILQVDVQRRSD